MGSFIALLLMIGLLVLWCFFKFPPRFAPPEHVRIFNIMAFCFCAFLCLMWAIRVRVNLAGTYDEKWIPEMTMAGILAIEIVVLGVFFLVRNFWLFKPKRRF